MAMRCSAYPSHSRSPRCAPPLPAADETKRQSLVRCRSAAPRPATPGHARPRRAAPPLCVFVADVGTGHDLERCVFHEASRVTRGQDRRGEESRGEKRWRLVDVEGLACRLPLVLPQARWHLSSRTVRDPRPLPLLVVTPSPP